MLIYSAQTRKNTHQRTWLTHANKTWNSHSVCCYLHVCHDLVQEDTIHQFHEHADPFLWAHIVTQTQRAQHLHLETDTLKTKTGDTVLHIEISNLEVFPFNWICWPTSYCIFNVKFLNDVSKRENVIRPICIRLKVDMLQIARDAFDETVMNNKQKYPSSLKYFWFSICLHIC